MTFKDLVRITPYIWEIPKTYRQDMRVPARIFASREMLAEIFRDKSIEQLINVSTLPGIVKYALVMPDVHEGYGFPIGGVAATGYPHGVISPGGIGYDINCGVRLLKSALTFKDIKGRRGLLARRLYEEIPSGVGRGGKLKLDDKKLEAILALNNADPDKVSKHAKERGRDQLGTMGAGNHFVEVDLVSEIFDSSEAKRFGLFEDQVVVQIHTGSRGLGHQVATDYIKIMINSLDKYGIVLPDRQIACVPFSSKEGHDYFSAMTAAANFAYENRNFIAQEAAGVFKEIFNAEISLLYDVTHNIAQIEEYQSKKVIVHRKGATRAFEGQPVFIPGSMGTASYVLAGTRESSDISFGSSCHGAGRLMSRHMAKRQISGKNLKISLENLGIFINTGSIAGLAEEAPLAYKDVHEVVDVVSKVGIANKVARLKPVVVVKG